MKNKLTARELQKQVSAVIYTALHSEFGADTAIDVVGKTEAPILRVIANMQPRYIEGALTDRHVANIKKRVEKVLGQTDLEAPFIDYITTKVLDKVGSKAPEIKTSSEPSRKFYNKEGKEISLEEHIASSKVFKDSKGRFQSKEDFLEENNKYYQLRNRKGNFQSPTSLANLIQQGLHDSLQENMTPPRLQYRTGRFANSVRLVGLEYNNRQDSLLAKLTYMKYPYQTFETGFKQGSLARDPRPLIDKSVRDVAIKLTKARMSVLVV
jgi:hypothetical protein